MTIFKNAHWQVLDDGVETIDPLPPYDFALDRVFETTSRSGVTYYDWPVHMAEKTWVDIGLFNEAFERAIRVEAEASGQAVDEARLERSYAESYRIAGRR